MTAIETDDWTITNIHNNSFVVKYTTKEQNGAFKPGTRLAQYFSSEDDAIIFARSRGPDANTVVLQQQDIQRQRIVEGKR